MAAAMAAVVVDTSAEAAISVAVTDILAYPGVEGTSIHPVVEAGFSGGFMDLGLALVRRASVRDISAGDSFAIGMSACSLSAAGWIWCDDPRSWYSPWWWDYCGYY
jgi:hypothetical protein